MIKKILKKILWYFNYDLSKIIFNYNLKEILDKLKVNKNDIEMQCFGQANKDGSYYVPKNLIKDIDYLISLGVGPTYEFEKDLSKENIKIQMYDASVDILPTEKNIKFIKKFVRPSSNDNSIDLNEIIETVNNKKIMLKMDIEGDEYANLLNLKKEYLSKIKIIIIEFHYLNRLIDKNFNREAIYAIEKLLSSHQAIFSKINRVSDNFKINKNFIPKYLEVTFIQNNK